MSKITCVVPSIRPAQMTSFRAAWAELFQKHAVTLVTVWDGAAPEVEVRASDGQIRANVRYSDLTWGDLICRHTDAVRNLGFLAAAYDKPDYVLTLDDDVAPLLGDDPIAAHIAALNRTVPISWMNTAHDGAEYLRGVPYEVRTEAPVMLSHGVWVGTPDFDGETQLRLEETTGVPETLPYFFGPVPRNVLFPMCGMNLMVRRDALPYLYFAPMGPDSGVPGLNRFADIWCGVALKQRFDELTWACTTGSAVVLHTRASDARKNVEQEKLGREWNEHIWRYKGWTRELPDDLHLYWTKHLGKRRRWAELIRCAFGTPGTECSQSPAELLHHAATPGH